MNIYYHKDGRAFVVIKRNNKWKSMSYARYLMECHIGRELNNKEEVHHKDGNKLNDVIENLEIKNSTEHRQEHNRKYYDTTEKCSICNKLFLVTIKQHRNRTREINRGKNKNRLWFCSKRCSGIYSSKL